MQAHVAPQLCLAICLLYANAQGQEVIATSAAQASPSDALARQAEQIRQMVHSFGDEASAPAQLVQLARGLEPAVAARLYLQIADDYLRTGHCNLAADVLLQLLEQFPDEPAATEATLLLLRLYSSSEVGHSQRQTPDTAGQLRLPPGWHKQSSSVESETSSEAAGAYQGTGMQEYALFVVDKQLQRHPEMAKDSAFAFQCAVASRISGQTQQSTSWLTLLKHKRESAQWRTRALVESWLAEGAHQEAPLPIVHCWPTKKPPYLDGILNEPIWEKAESFAPSSEISNLRSEIFLAYDAEHCYLAIHCQRNPDVEYRPDNRPRTYDADLQGQDHMVIRLDADRDYASYYELAIDHRGWTADTCWQDTSWNPQWFVAAGGRNRTWTVEAAIPWVELAASPPRPGEVWTVSVRRVAPSQQPAVLEDVASHDFQLLRFD